MSLLTVYGAPEGFDAALIARRAAEAGVMLHIARDDARLARIADALGFFAPDAEIIRFPAWDCLPYDRVSPNPAIMAERVSALARLLDPATSQRIVLTTINAAVQRTPPRSQFKGASFAIAPGASVAPDELARFLEQHGYHRVGTVMEPGDFAIRGGIFDVWPSGESAPTRMDLFGDVVETLRRFDPGTQRSGEPVASLVFRPASELPLDADSVSRFRTGFREAFGVDALKDPTYLAISEGRRQPGMEHFAPLFAGAMETIFDYVPNAAISLDHQSGDAAAARFEMIADHYQARLAPARPGELPYRPIKPELLYFEQSTFTRLLSSRQATEFSPFGKPDGATGVEAGGRPGAILAAGQSGVSVYDEFKSLAVRWREAGRKVILAAWSTGSRDRLAALLRDHGMRSIPIDNAAEARIAQGDAVLLAVLGLERGYVADDFAIVAEQDLLGARIARPPRRRQRADQFIADATEIAEGDLVVHQEHGIGRYDGLVTLSVDGAPHDCLRLLYDGDHKLFLPVENIDLLSCFGTETAGVGLDRLGGASWQARKARAKNRIRDMAAELI
ncbi:MAG: CarD family transcriptional regulator, partial [Acidiphilium sp.]|nr:CarD family transcriptional regulator [Acidiphilium sp.]